MELYAPVFRKIAAEEIDDSSVLKILVATDCHLGYEETDPVIGEDSFNTFEEVLTKAVDEQVDIILLGGDLFHLNNPSQKTMNKCIELLRQYTLGSQNLSLKLLSKATDVFSHCITQRANFLDENISVSIPVFSIHGNHDDPSGIAQQSSMDTLSSAGLVNYFGKCTDLNNIRIKPIVIKKERTYIALYGLGHIKDDRLCRLFISERVTFLEPEVAAEKCFRILVLHQNRVDRGPKRFVSESFIPSFFDFVIWGHEHDCEIQPSWNIENEFFVIQAGSTVATSLSEGEAIPKHIGVLKLWQDYSNFKPIKLNTVRPFIWKSIPLFEIPISNDEQKMKSEKIKEHCRLQVEEMIKEANGLITGHPKQPKLPLIRLRCEYTDDTQMFNMVKFSQQFLNRVATPNLEIIKFKKVVDAGKKREPSERAEVLSELKALYGKNIQSMNFSECVNRIVNDYFMKHAEASLTVLSVKEMEEAVEKFLDKGETGSIQQTVERTLKKVMALVMNHQYDDQEGVLRELEKIKEEMLSKSVDVEKVEKQIPQTVVESDSDTDKYEPVLNSNSPPILNKSSNDVKEERSDEDEPSQAGRKVAVRGTSRGRGRGQGQGRGASKVEFVVRSTRKAAARQETPQKKSLKFAVASTVSYGDDDSD